MSTKGRQAGKKKDRRRRRRRRRKRKRGKWKRGPSFLPFCNTLLYFFVFPTRAGITNGDDKKKLYQAVEWLTADALCKLNETPSIHCRPRSQRLLMPFLFFFFFRWLVTILPACQRHTNWRNGDFFVILPLTKKTSFFFRLLVRRFIFSGDKRIRTASVVRRKKGPRDSNQWSCVRNTWSRTVFSATERREKRQSERMSSQHPPIPVNCSNLDSGAVP